LNRLGEFFNRSTSILIAEARIALEPSKRISRVEIAGEQSKPSASFLSPAIKLAFALHASFYIRGIFLAHFG